MVYHPIVPPETHREVTKVNTYTSDSSEKPSYDRDLEEKRERSREMQSDFEELMRYDVATAYKRKSDLS